MNPFDANGWARAIQRVTFSRLPVRELAEWLEAHADAVRASVLRDVVTELDALGMTCLESLRARAHEAEARARSFRREREGLPGGGRA